MIEFFTREFAVNAASNDRSAVMIATVEIWHPAFVEGNAPRPVRLCADGSDRSFRLEPEAQFDAGQIVPFAGVPFAIEMPAFEEGRGAELTLRVDQIGDVIGPWLDEAVTIQSDVIVTVRAYLSHDPDHVQLGPWRLYAKSTRLSATTFEAALSIAPVERLRVCRQVYDLARFPTLLTVS
jgi:hypothetical protein